MEDFKLNLPPEERPPSLRSWRRTVEPEESSLTYGLGFMFGTPIRLAVTIAFICGMVGILWYSFSPDNLTPVDQGFPLIQAEEGPLKVKPEHPGGIEVPHQDKFIYDRLSPQSGSKNVAGNNGDTIERLLPNPEPLAEMSHEDNLAFSENIKNPTMPTAPVHIPSLSSSEDSGTANLEQEDLTKKDFENNLGRENYKAQESTLNSKSPSSSSEVPSSSLPNTLSPLIKSDSTSKANIEQPKPKKSNIKVSEHPATLPSKESISSKVETSTSLAKMPKSTSGTSQDNRAARHQSTTPLDESLLKGRIYVQLGSMRSFQQAQAEKQRLWKGNKGLNTQKAHIIKIDLGAKGVYYRLLAGPLPNKATATHLCQKLKQKKISCQVKN